MVRFGSPLKYFTGSLLIRILVAVCHLWIFIIGYYQPIIKSISLQKPKQNNTFDLKLLLILPMERSERVLREARDALGRVVVGGEGRCRRSRGGGPSIGLESELEVPE